MCVKHLAAHDRHSESDSYRGANYCYRFPDSSEHCHSARSVPRAASRVLARLTSQGLSGERPAAFLSSPLTDKQTESQRG